MEKLNFIVEENISSQNANRNVIYTRATSTDNGREPRSELLNVAFFSLLEARTKKHDEALCIFALSLFFLVFGGRNTKSISSSGNNNGLFKAVNTSEML